MFTGHLIHKGGVGTSQGILGALQLSRGLQVEGTTYAQARGKRQYAVFWGHPTPTSAHHTSNPVSRQQPRRILKCKRDHVSPFSEHFNGPHGPAHLSVLFHHHTTAKLVFSLPQGLCICCSLCLKHCSPFFTLLAPLHPVGLKLQCYPLWESFLTTAT